jgi:hypothetical protein
MTSLKQTSGETFGAILAAQDNYYNTLDDITAEMSDKGLASYLTNELDRAATYSNKALEGVE